MMFQASLSIAGRCAMGKSSSRTRKGMQRRRQNKELRKKVHEHGLRSRAKAAKEAKSKGKGGGA